MSVDACPGPGGRSGDAERLEAVAPGYLERVRELAARLGVAQAGDDARGALAVVEDLAVIDVDAPTASTLMPVGWLKAVIKRLVRWYLGYVGRQMTAFGQAVADLGGLLLERTEAVESATTALRADLDELGQRVRSLEQAARQDR
jgi:hypothetical protein